jgi:hypothetical protein
MFDWLHLSDKKLCYRYQPFKPNTFSNSSFSLSVKIKIKLKDVNYNFDGLIQSIECVCCKILFIIVKVFLTVLDVIKSGIFPKHYIKHEQQTFQFFLTNVIPKDPKNLLHFTPTLRFTSGLNFYTFCLRLWFVRETYSEKFKSCQSLRMFSSKLHSRFLLLYESAFRGNVR